MDPLKYKHNKCEYFLNVDRKQICIRIRPLRQCASGWCVKYIYNFALWTTVISYISFTIASPSQPLVLLAALVAGSRSKTNRTAPSTAKGKKTSAEKEADNILKLIDRNINNERNDFNEGLLSILITALICNARL